MRIAPAQLGTGWRGHGAGARTDAMVAAADGRMWFASIGRLCVKGLRTTREVTLSWLKGRAELPARSSENC